MGFLRLDMWDNSQQWTPDELEQFFGLVAAELAWTQSSNLDEQERAELVDECLEVLDEIAHEMPEKLRERYGYRD